MGSEGAIGTIIGVIIGAIAMAWIKISRNSYEIDRQRTQDLIDHYNRLQEDSDERFRRIESRLEAAETNHAKCEQNSLKLVAEIESLKLRIQANDSTNYCVIAADEHDKIVDACDNLSYIFGYRPIELAGKDLEILLPGIDLHATSCTIQGIQKDGSSVDLVLAIDGRIIECYRRDRSGTQG